MPILSVTVRCVLITSIFSSTASGSPDAPATRPHTAPLTVPASRYCGLYCTYAALRLHSIDLRFEELVHPKYVGSMEGSSLSELKRAIEDRALHAVIARNLTTTALRRQARPVILHVKSSSDQNIYDHYILYRGDLEGSAVVFDPPHPARVIPYSELAPIWGGVGLIVSDHPIRLRWWNPGFAGALLSMGILASIVHGVVAKKSRSVSSTPGYVRVVTGACVIISTSVAAGAIVNVSTDLGLFGRLLAAAATGLREEKLPTISATEAYELWETRQAVFIDARLRNDFDAGHIPGAISVPINSSASKREILMAAIPKDARIVVYCQNSRCAFSNNLGMRLKEEGYTDVTTYLGGWEQWQDQNAGRAR